jgi:hypothetical protein
MTDPIPFKPVDESIQRRQLADAAHELLNNKAFTTAILELRKQWFAAMMDSTEYSVDRALKAQIKALEMIPQELQILINNQKMAEARKK